MLVTKTKLPVKFFNPEPKDIMLMAPIMDMLIDSIRNKKPTDNTPVTHSLERYLLLKRIGFCSMFEKELTKKEIKLYKTTIHQRLYGPNAISTESEIDENPF